MGARRWLKKQPYIFHVEMTDFNPVLRDKDEIESKSEILWVKPEELIRLFNEQGKKYSRDDIDEPKVIENYLKYVSHNLRC